MKAREWHPDIPTPTNEWFWPCTVISEDDSFIEVEFYREPLPWLVKLTESLSPNHRTWSKQTMKVYKPFPRKP